MKMLYKQCFHLKNLPQIARKTEHTSSATKGRYSWYSAIKNIEPLSWYIQRNRLFLNDTLNSVWSCNGGSYEENKNILSLDLLKNSTNIEPEQNVLDLSRDQKSPLIVFEIIYFAVMRIKGCTQAVTICKLAMKDR